MKIRRIYLPVYPSLKENVSYSCFTGYIRAEKF